MLPLAALVLAVAVSIGALLAQVASSIPLAIHACAEQGGRHALLGSAAEAATPSAGQRASPRFCRAGGGDREGEPWLPAPSSLP